VAAACCVVMISVLSLKQLKFAVEAVVEVEACVVEMAPGVGFHDQRISAEATSLVLPSELTHHLTLTTANFQLLYLQIYVNVIMLNCSTCVTKYLKTDGKRCNSLNC